MLTSSLLLHSRGLTYQILKFSAIHACLNEHMIIKHNNINIRQIIVDKTKILHKKQCKEKTPKAVVNLLSKISRCLPAIK